MLLWLTLARAVDIPVPAGADLATVVASAADGDRLLLAAGTFHTGGLTLSGRTLDLVGEGADLTVLVRGGTRTVVDIGSGQVRLADLTVDGQERRPGIRVGSGSLVLDQVDVVGGRAYQGGSGLRVDGGTVQILGGRFEDNRTSHLGGHLRAIDASVHATGTQFVDGRAWRGGAVHADQGELTLQDCTFEQHTAIQGEGHGGAVRALGTQVSIQGGGFVGNTASRRGGAVSVEGGGSLELSGARFQANQAAVGGAVACRDAARCALIDPQFHGNLAGSGGAVWLSDVDDFQVDGGLFCANQAQDGVGGALRVGASAGEVRWTWLLDNTATGSGGAVQVEGASTLQLAQVSFLDNGAALGPALYAADAAQVSVLNTAVLWSDGPEAAMVFEAQPSSMRHTLWYGNGVDGEPLGEHAVLADPLYPDAARHRCDPALLISPAGSPLIDAGDPALRDPDGSPSDIGAGPPDGLAPVHCADLAPGADLAGVPGALAICPDADGDGHGDADLQVWICEPTAAQRARPCDDCDDTRAEVHPGALDLSGVEDRDCSGDIATIRYGNGCSEARGCSGSAAWMIVLPLPLLLRRRR